MSIDLSAVLGSREHPAGNMDGFALACFKFLGATRVLNRAREGHVPPSCHTEAYYQAPEMLSPLKDGQLRERLEL
jgi:hypothetical protein